MLMAGANPDFFNGKYYWPNPLSEAVSAMNPETVRLLVAAGADVNTMEMVVVGIGSYEFEGLIDYAETLEPSWIENQESFFMSELLGAFGFRSGQDIYSSEGDPFGDHGTDYSAFEDGDFEDEAHVSYHWNKAHRSTAAEPDNHCAIM